MTQTIGSGMTAAAVQAARTPATPAVAAGQDRADMIKAAKGFEAIFVRQLMATMREGSLAEDDLTGNDAVSQFRELSDAKMAEGLSERGGLGIAEMILKQLDKKG